MSFALPGGGRLLLTPPAFYLRDEMSIQPTFDFATPAPQKRVADTSRESYAEVRVNLGERQLKVLRALHYYFGHPTTSELMASMHATDPNSVRPRLTELKDLRMVEVVGKKKCPITGKRVGVWMVTERGRLYLRSKA